MSTLFSKQLNTAITFEEYLSAGWSAEDYLEYLDKCAHVRATIIVNEQRPEQEIAAIIRQEVAEILEMYGAVTEAPVVPDYDVAYVLAINIRYLQHDNYDGAGVLPYFYRSEADFRCLIEQQVYNIINGNTAVTIQEIPFCETKAKALSLKNDYETERKRLVDALEFALPEDINEITLYAWARNKAEVIHRIEDIDDRTAMILNRIEEFENGGEFDPQSSTLYVYKGRIKCEREHHNIICVNALIPTIGRRRVSINVNYCTNCRQFFISYAEYTHYMARYGSLIAKIVLVSDDTQGNFADQLAAESPLKLCGYSVSQEKGFTQQEREELLETVIRNGIMRKPEVIKYLTWFIQMNGQRFGNEIARSKWSRDLAFVRDLHCEGQSTYSITSVAPYPGYVRLSGGGTK